MKNQSAAAPAEIKIKDSPYRLQRVAPGLDRWACTLTKLDGPRKGSRYRVALDHRGRWRCQCEAYRFCHSPDGRRPYEHRCKHATEVARLWALAKEIAPLTSG